MGFSVTVFFYLLIGLPVAVALWLNDRSISDGRLFRCLTAPLFWPLYIPLLFASPAMSPQSIMKVDSKIRSSDEMSSMITKVEAELDTALKSLDGWSENALADERSRISELRIAWRHQADSIRQLDRLLLESSAPTPSQSSDPALASMGATSESDQVVPKSVIPHEESRSQNLQKLKRVRRQLYEDLMATLAWVRELVTMIHLAKYTGAPASRAVELVQQIAAAVEGLSKVNQPAA